MDLRPLAGRGCTNIRDVSYGEDASQIRTSNGPQVMALSNLAIAILPLCLPTGASYIAPDNQPKPQ
jgi:hypothetical protein